MQELYKRYVLYQGPQILTYKGSIRALRNESGFISNHGSQILNVFKRIFLLIWFIDWFSKDSTSFHKYLVHRRTMNNSESIQILCFGFANPYPVQKIRFVDSFCLLCSKDLFCGFDLDTCFQITCFVYSFRNFFKFFFLKFLYLYWFGRIHIWILQSYFFVPHQLVII
jgi:hypothetical protein